MKLSKKILATAVAGSAIAVSSIAPAVNAEVAASVSVASSYLWRGLDLGNGTPAVSGDLSYSQAGAYGGVWVSSGDTTAGTEFDLYAGYGGSIGEFSYDVSVWNYVYPEGGASDDTFGDLSELVIGLGFGPVSLAYYDNIANESGGNDYSYGTIGGEFGAFSATYGIHMGDDSDEFSHIDFSYAYNDNLSFTFSQVVDDNDGAVDDDLKVVVSYSLPIE